MCVIDVRSVAKARTLAPSEVACVTLLCRKYEGNIYCSAGRSSFLTTTGISYITSEIISVLYVECPMIIFIDLISSLIGEAERRRF